MMSSAVPTASIFGPPASGESAERRVAPPPPWEHLWFTLLQRPWSSLAIVPARRGLDPLVTARGLAAISQAYLEHAATVIDATRITPSDVAVRLRAATERTAAGGRVIVASGSPLERAACIPMVRGTDAAVLLVQIGSTALAEARRTIDVVGASHFIGAITVPR